MAYIDKDLIRDEILSNAVRLNHPKDLCTETTLYLIDVAPVADVVEVKHGEWLLDGRCSECLAKPLTTHVSY